MPLTTPLAIAPGASLTPTFAEFPVWLIVLGGVAVVGVLWLIGIYNGCVRLRNRVKNSWSQIDVQLKRRYDLIPNLVEVAKKFMSHEKEVLVGVTEARSACMNASGVQEQAAAENMLTGALKTLFAVSENYPELKSDRNMLQIQEELTATENRIGFARQHYNDSVMEYNTKIESAPTVFVAGMFGFEAAEFFEIEEPAQREVPKVDFG